MLVTLKDIMKDAVSENKSVAAFNIFAYEDVRAVIDAAEELGAPVILMNNKDAVNFRDVEEYANMIRPLAEKASVPVCLHLDHASDYDLIARAIKAGYTSVMYDGSSLPLEENIKNTKEIVKLAHACGVTTEAEIGFVPYGDVKSIYTEPEEAKYFNEETGVDGLAVAIGTVHRMEAQEADIQFDRLKKITELIDTPIVIHGSTGIKDEDLQKLTKYGVGKVNIGTALRIAYLKALKEELDRDPDNLDRIRLYTKPMEAVKEAAKEKMRLLGW